jgi:RNA polymerase sigma factor (sigma-70 family)
LACWSDEALERRDTPRFRIFRMTGREPFGLSSDYTDRVLVPRTEPNPTDDELLAIRCQLGEPAAFADLITRWHAPLWSFVRRLAGEDDAAREILQDVWVRVIRGIPQLRDGSRLRAWLFGIARRTLMDRLRQQYARSATVDVDVDEIAADPSAAEDAEDLQELEGALADVPVVEREVLTLFYLHELSLNEVAEALNVPVGTIKSRLFRAKRLLRQTMTARGIRP